MSVGFSLAFLGDSSVLAFVWIPCVTFSISLHIFAASSAAFLLVFLLHIFVHSQDTNVKLIAIIAY